MKKQKTKIKRCDKCYGDGYTTRETYAGPEYYVCAKCDGSGQLPPGKRLNKPLPSL